MTRRERRAIRRPLLWIALHIPLGKLQPYIMGLALGRMPERVSKEEAEILERKLAGERATAYGLEMPVTFHMSDEEAAAIIDSLDSRRPAAPVRSDTRSEPRAE